MKPILAIVLLLGLAACGKPEQPAPAPSVEATAVPAVEPISVTAPPATVSVSTPAPSAPETDAAPTRPTPPVTMPAPGPRVIAPAVAIPSATPSPAPVAASAPDPGAGRQTYQQACAFCHDKGVAGAPRFGDAAAWSARTAQSMETLYASAIRGKGAMPAKGGNPSLSDDAVKAAVDYLVAGSR